ncbi:ABZJ_00895 family protein [Acinetobacter sp.]|jgi:hypothetical protein|uniref:ABZJ_00895 family protein n=1 Tax=Acinetobacter sp. TaxID=472 RepID=UPI0035B0A04F
MKKYILYFSLCYGAAVVITAIIVSFFDLPGGTSAACLIAAGFAAAMKFAQDQQRAPNPKEKKQLIWGCLGASVLLSMLASAVSLFIFSETAEFFSMLKAVPVWVWLLAIALTLAIHYLVLALSFGWFARRSAKTVQK